MTTYAERLTTLLALPAMPEDSFTALMQEIVDICEPLAAPGFAALAADRRNIGPQSILASVNLVWNQIWCPEVEYREHARKYILGLAAVADGTESFGGKDSEPVMSASN